LHRSRLRWLALLCCCVPRLEYWPKRRVLPGPAHYAIQHFGERFGLGSATVLSMAQDGRLSVDRRRRDSIAMTGTASRTLAGPKACERPGGTGFGGADGSVWVRSRKGLQDRSMSTSKRSLAGGGDALRDSFQSFAVDGHGSVFVATQGGLLRLQPDSGRYHCSQRKCCSGGRDRCCWLGRRTNTIWFAARNRIGAFCGKIRTRECRGA